MTLPIAGQKSAGAQYAWGLLVIRVLMGAFFLMEGVQQVAGGWIGGEQPAEKFRKAGPIPP